MIRIKTLNRWLFSAFVSTDTVQAQLSHKGQRKWDGGKQQRTANTEDSIPRDSELTNSLGKNLMEEISF